MYVSHFRLTQYNVIAQDQANCDEVIFEVVAHLQLVAAAAVAVGGRSQVGVA